MGALDLELYFFTHLPPWYHTRLALSGGSYHIRLALSGGSLESTALLLQGGSLSWSTFGVLAPPVENNTLDYHIFFQMNVYFIES